MKLPFEKLIVWQKSIKLAKQVFIATRAFPSEERYGLTSQILKCAVSVPSNIAEGSQRSTDKDFANFISIARGSWAELKTQLVLAYEFQYISQDVYQHLMMHIDEVGKMLNAFHQKLTATR